ncbi:MAG TPA: AraC family transcriptional regulator, partial [Alcanivorax sp.]|nr:AraC family transcriptional regulator [Alcanivorax sp.]
LLSRWLAGQPPQPRRLDGALALLSRAAPGVTVTALSARLNLSRRQLERDFLEWVGVPPKVFMGIRRSQQALALLSRPSPAAPLADIALAAGYTDQSHMTRELKRYLG